MKKIISILAVLILVVAGVVGFNAYSDINGKFKKDNDITIEVPKGSGANAIGKILKSSGVIKSDLFFKLYTKSNPPQNLQYGEFELNSNMSYSQILTKLTEVKDRRETITVTIPEGSTIIKFAQLVEKTGLCSQKDFIDAVEKTDWSKYKFYQHVEESPNKPFKMEGFLFPDTYEFYKEATPVEIAEKMVAHFDNMITDDMYNELSKTGLSLQQLITLASYVQEEAGDPINQADVAAVFYNRLKPNSPYPKLQSDVSYYYIREFIEPYMGLKRDKIPTEMRDAINTYFCVGIPVTPVSSPGIEAIKNTLNPTKDSPYYFFLTDLTGKYYYAQTLAEHNANVTTMKQVNAGVDKK